MIHYKPHLSEIKTMQKKHGVDHKRANILLRGGYIHGIKLPPKSYSGFVKWVDEQNFSRPQYLYLTGGHYFFRDESLATMVKLMFG